MLRPFNYIKPSSLTEAIKLKLEFGESAHYLAGGTDLFVNVRNGKLKPKLVIDLKGIRELYGIEQKEDGVFIGALTRMKDIVYSDLLRKLYPVLVEGASVLGDKEIRNRATIGGNVCNASPSGDTIPALFVYEARVVVVSEKGERRELIWDFLKGPGRTSLGDGELVKGFLLPVPPSGSVGKYVKLSRSRGMDLPSLGVAVLYPPLRIAYGAVAPTVVRAKEVEDFLNAHGFTPDSISKAKEMIFSAYSPRPTSLRATPLYKKVLASELPFRILQDLGVISDG